MKKKNKFIRKGIENLKENTWFDYDYMIDLEYIKIEQMLYGYTHNKTYSEGSDFVIRDLKLALKLLDIHNNNPTLGVRYEGKETIENSRVYCKKYVNTKNFKRFLPKLYESLKDKNNIPSTFIVALYEEKAWNCYCKLREYRMRTWWD